MSCVAITLGPISSTIELTNSPAGLWAASGIFSYIAENFCRKIEENFADAKIVNPIHISKTGEPFEIQKDGIGKYHDRIFFFTDENEESIKKKLNEIKSDIIDEIAVGLSEVMKKDKDKIKKFLEDYLVAHYIVDTSVSLDNNENQENYIISLSPYLDSLEWSGQYQSTFEENYLLTFFEGKNGQQNEYIKGSFLVPDDTKKIQLLNAKRNVRQIEEIANPENKNPKEMKYSQYFAVVKADGDNMGKVLKNVIGGDVEKLQKFSQTCRKYLEEASNLVGDFGGLTVYAGGDDLMFLAPIYNNDNEKNIFELIDTIHGKFDDIVQENLSGYIDEYNRNNIENHVDAPTLSFGVSINYVKFPLREAVKLSSDLLYKAKDAGRNSIAYSLRKNSGQNCELCYSFDNGYGGHLQELIKSLSGTDTSKSDKALHSILYHLRAGTQDTQSSANTSSYHPSTYELIIKSVLDSTLNSDDKKKRLEEVFNNLFDSSVQKQAESFLKKIQQALLDGVEYSDLLQMMWTAKFFVEKSGKE